MKKMWYKKRAFLMKARLTGLTDISVRACQVGEKAPNTEMKGKYRCR